jgi:hypothetical protein
MPRVRIAKLAEWTNTDEAMFFPELYRNVQCPKCHVLAGERCLSRWDKRMHYAHVQRVLKSKEESEKTNHSND